MNESRGRLIDETLAAFLQLSQANQAATGPVWLRVEATVAQLRGISVIQAAGQLTVGQFAEELGIGKSAGSIMVDRLVHMGLVERAVAPDDRRRAIVRLSPRGERLLADLNEGGLASIRGWLTQLADADLSALVRGIQALVAVALAEGRSPAGRESRPAAVETQALAPCG